ncbi:MAG: hypothetical protein JO015_03225 [Verrucomicrobia bacterium]|nr:hypothetical protein [Verrucomicrobiota bacterium]
METSTDTALVVSVHQFGPGREVRVNLRWQGKHDVGDFELDQLGTMSACDVETEHTCWAVIDPRHPVTPGDSIPLRPRSI